MAEQRRLRLVSWNIKVGSLQGLDAVLDELRHLAPDIVLLQEVDNGVERSGSVDQAAYLARGLDPLYDQAFAATIDLEGGAYGIAILSRVPIQATKRIPLSNVDNAELRTALEARLCFGSRELKVINHHADYVRSGAMRSLREIAAELMDGSDEEALIVAGDFNQEPEDEGILALIEAGFDDVLGEEDPRPTMDGRRIDYIFAAPRVTRSVVGAGVVYSPASDHAAVYVDLQMD
jgi:endonuclease/exonuclease/phosphatase family metal-dependent hydrolase